MTLLPPVRQVPWHGRELALRRGGEGPSVVLIHGMAGSLTTWDSTFAGLMRTCDVIALDLPGHGTSSPLRGDFSLGSLASAVRDLLDTLHVPAATVVGHSLGGGIAMQFHYQFPDRTQRLALISSGGLGPEVTPLLRMLTVPGAGLALAGLTHLQRNKRVTALGRLARPAARLVWNDLPYMTRQMGTLNDPDIRASFLATVHAVIDRQGQRISAIDRLYLAADLPTLIIWGDRDQIIPISHGRDAAAQLPHSQFTVVAGAGHYPHEDHPDTVVAVLAAFIARTPPVQAPAG